MDDVSGRHDHLYVATEGPVHGLAPEYKVAATVVFVFAVVATPREAVWAFGVDALRGAHGGARSAACRSPTCCAG